MGVHPCRVLVFLLAFFAVCSAAAVEPESAAPRTATGADRSNAEPVVAERPLGALILTKPEKPEGPAVAKEAPSKTGPPKRPPVASPRPEAPPLAPWKKKQRILGIGLFVAGVATIPLAAYACYEASQQNGAEATMFWNCGSAAIIPAGFMIAGTVTWKRATREAPPAPQVSLGLGPGRVSIYGRW